MKQSHKLAMGAIVASALATAVATGHAHPGQGQSGGGMEPHMQGGMQHGAQGGMAHGMKGGVGHGAQRETPHGGMGSAHGGPGVAQQLMTPEERAALREKMHSAATPEERQQIAATTRAEMQKCAQEKGITPREHRGPRAGATTENAH